MFNDFVSADTTPLYLNATDSDKKCHLLWGDGVKFNGPAGTGARRPVKARGGRSGFVKKTDLGGQSLLEYYFIDVGQGDGILIKTPNFRHILIDGGWPRSSQDTKKNAADFVDWKFVKDYGMSTIEIDALVASHCDADHYGGLSDLLDVSQSHELDATDVRVEVFYHAGLSWWKSPSGKKLGDFETQNGDKFWTQLLDDRTHANQVTTGTAGQQLHGWWRDFITRVVAAKRKSGSPTRIQRLSSADDFVPGFDDSNPAEPAIHMLGPVEFTVNGKPGVRRFSSTTSQNTNGVSLLMRVDFGPSRVLLTGDLNKASQATLLEDYTGNRLEFKCDVAKACHHGAEDISYKFLQAMEPGATVISSGDNEGHDHPRPSVIAASATTGHLQLSNDEDDLLTPLIFSTELARSVDLGFPEKLEEIDSTGAVTDSITGVSLDRAKLHLKNTKRDSVRMGNAMVVGGLIYGLVNVRTDGHKILCATLDEQSSEWRIHSFNSRF